MKTKINGCVDYNVFGSSMSFPLTRPRAARAAAACRKNKKETVFEYWYTEDLTDWFYKEPLDDYRKNRENGEDADSPKYPYPHDGLYGWDHPENDTVYAEYEEGDGDKAWMEEKDHNYVLRLERTGQLQQIEPNLKQEVPKLFLAVLAVRNNIDEKTLLAEFNKQLQDLERQYIEMKARWRKLDNDFRETCVAYWQTYYDNSGWNGKNQAVLQKEEIMQKAKAPADAARKELDEFEKRKHQAEIEVVNNIEKTLMQKRIYAAPAFPEQKDNIQESKNISTLTDILLNIRTKWQRENDKTLFEQYNQIIKQYPDSTAAYFERAMFCIMVGDKLDDDDDKDQKEALWQKALKDLKAVLENDPFHDEAKAKVKELKQKLQTLQQPTAIAPYPANATNANNLNTHGVFAANNANAPTPAEEPGASPVNKNNA